MDVQVNIWGVLAATAVSMVIGSIWYSKLVFGKVWMKMEGVDEKKARQNAGKAIAGMLLLSLLIAYVLAHIIYLSNYFYATASGYSFFTSGVMTGFWVWLGFVFPITASNSLFAQKPWKLTVINAGNWLVTLLAMGIVIGAIGV